jgi:hypothetical protein
MAKLFPSEGSVSDLTIYHQFRSTPTLRAFIGTALQFAR